MALSHWDYGYCYPTFYVCAGDLNWGSHVWQALNPLKRLPSPTFKRFFKIPQFRINTIVSSDCLVTIWLSIGIIWMIIFQAGKDEAMPPCPPHPQTHTKLNPRVCKHQASNHLKWKNLPEKEGKYSFELLPMKDHRKLLIKSNKTTCIWKKITPERVQFM